MEKLTLQRYHEVEEKFYTDLINLVGNKLLFYCVTGSSGRMDVIPGWSDIDVILVFEELSEFIFDSLIKSFRLNKFDIKIGTTFYSLKEWNTYKFQDPKTFNAIRYIHCGVYRPRMLNPKVLLHKLTIEMLEIVNRVNLSNELSILKRAVLEKQSERVVYKLILNILRISLLNQGIIAGGYHDIWKKAQIHFDNFPLPKITPEEIMVNPERYTERAKHYFSFLNWLGNDLHA